MGSTEEKRSLEVQVHDTIRELQRAAHDGEWRLIGQEAAALVELMAAIEVLDA